MMLRERLKNVLPDSAIAASRMIRSPGWFWRNREDLPHIVRFVADANVRSIPFRLSMVWHCLKIQFSVACPHRESEILAIVSCILQLPQHLDGCIVEAGCFKGGSTAKISLAARHVGRQLKVFDSFEGLPPSSESQVTTIFGDVRDFSEGRYQGTLDEVKENVARYGAPEVCTFVKGWFDETMKGFSAPIAVIFLDVDLSDSTRTCIRYLYPQLVEGGYLFTHDGHLPAVIEVLQDVEFWERETGRPPPQFVGLGKRKFVWAQKSGSG